MNAPITFGEVMDDLAEQLRRNGRLEFKKAALETLVAHGMHDAARVIAGLYKEDLEQ